MRALVKKTGGRLRCQLSSGYSVTSGRFQLLFFFRHHIRNGAADIGLGLVSGQGHHVAVVRSTMSLRTVRQQVIPYSGRALRNKLNVTLVWLSIQSSCERENAIADLHEATYTIIASRTADLAIRVEAFY